MHTYTDEYGLHEHKTSVPGRAYEPNIPITCKSCINRLTTVLDAWQETLTKRHNLPNGFWKGYKRGWEK